MNSNWSPTKSIPCSHHSSGGGDGGGGGGGGGGGELPPCGKGEPFLCTGDLGFVWESRLYIVGRIKDILCIRGRTLHAHDIETCAEAAHTAMRPGCCAALPVVPPDTGQDTDGEALVLVAELKPEAEKAAAAGGGAAIAEAVRDGVREAEGVKAYAVVLLRARTILKTTSGKLRRRELRLAYAELDDAVRAAAAAAADGRKAEPAQKLRVPLDAVLHFWRDAGKPARKAAEPDAEPDPAAGGGSAVSLQEGSEKVQLPVRSVPRNDSELSALGTARGSEPSREPSRGDAAGKAEAELDDAGGGGPSATEQLGSGAELDSLDGERREAGREMMLAAAEGAAEAGCSPGMGWALRRTYLLAWGLHIPADDSLHATSAPAGGEPGARLPMLRSCPPHACGEGSVFTVGVPTARSRVRLRAGQLRRGLGRAAARLQSIWLYGRRRRVVRGAGLGHGGGAQKGADGG